MPNIEKLRRKSLRYAVLSLLLCVFFMGGGARDDILSLVILRPLACLFLGLGLILVPWRAMTAHWPLYGLLLAFALIGALQLIPLPPSIYLALPGQELAGEVYRELGTPEHWKPLSIAPLRTWNALFAMIVPLAMLVLASGIDSEDEGWILKAILIIGLVSAVFGILQVIGEPGGPLYLYRITNEAEAVGLFSNRNHQAFLIAMLFPLLAFAASVQRIEAEKEIFLRNVALLVGVALLPLVLVTGSRGGLLLALVGIGAALALYKPPASLRAKQRKVTPINARYVIYGLALAGILLFAFLMTRSNSLGRLFADEANSASRSNFWPYLPGLGADYFPLGSGLGTFVEAYAIREPDHLLDSRYVNHAHNEFLELLITVGLPGLLVIAAALVLWAAAGWRLFRSQWGFSSLAARSAFVASAILIVASIADYPLRTPSMASVFAFLSVVIYRGAFGRNRATGDDRSTCTDRNAGRQSQTSLG